MSYGDAFERICRELLDQLDRPAVGFLRRYVTLRGKQGVLDDLRQNEARLLAFLAATPARARRALPQTTGDRQLMLFYAWQIAQLGAALEKAAIPANRDRAYRPTLAHFAQDALLAKALPFPRWPFGPPDPFA